MNANHLAKFARESAEKLLTANQLSATGFALTREGNLMTIKADGGDAETAIDLLFDGLAARSEELAAAVVIDSMVVDPAGERMDAVTLHIEGGRKAFQGGSSTPYAMASCFLPSPKFARSNRASSPATTKTRASTSTFRRWRPRSASPAWLSRRYPCSRGPTLRRCWCSSRRPCW